MNLSEGLREYIHIYQPLIVIISLSYLNYMPKTTHDVLLYDGFGYTHSLSISSIVNCIRNDKRKYLPTLICKLIGIPTCFRPILGQRLLPLIKVMFLIFEFLWHNICQWPWPTGQHLELLFLSLFLIFRMLGIS